MPRRLSAPAVSLVCLAVCCVPTGAHAAPACAADGSLARVDPDQITNLNGTWSFRPGDDLAWAAPVLTDERGWTPVEVPIGWGRRHPVSSLAWYRRTVCVTGSGSLASLAVAIGKVNSAYELYAGGIRVGGVGRLPPDPSPNWDRHAVFPIPAVALGADGRLVLALRVWDSPATRATVGGPVEGPYRIGPRHELVRAETLSEVPDLVLIAIVLAVALVHLLVYRRRPHLREYLWFTACTLLISAYLLLRTQWKFALSDDFVLLKRAEHVVAFLLGPAFAEFLWRMLGLPFTRTVRVFGLACLGSALATVGLASPVVDRWLVSGWQAMLLGFTVYGLVLLARRAPNRVRREPAVVWGLALLIAAYVSDVAVDIGWLQAPQLLPYGFLAFVIVMAVTLAGRFSRVHAELAGLHRELEQRVHSRTRELEERTEQLAAANRDLEHTSHRLAEASQAKSAFLAGLSHEIRTPMSGVIGMAHLLLGTPLTPQQRTYAETLRDSGRALVDLVGAVLDLSKVEAGRLELDEIDFAPRPVLGGAVRVHAGVARQKGVELSCRIDEGVPSRLRGDPGRLRQIVTNLVGNAVRFTEKGHVLVRVSASRADAAWQLRVEVEDTGIGIPSSVGERVFEPYFQVPSGDSGRGGTGLGLALVRRLVELHDGEIGYDSQPGRGSRFWFQVRLAPARGVAARPAEAVAARPGRVLLAEDSEVAAAVVSGLLRQQGHAVETVSAGEAAVEAVRRGGFDAVLMDCQMPGMDGFAATRAIRALPGDAARTPIIALTASALTGDRERCLAAGMDDYLAKPVGPEDLAVALARHLGSAPASVGPAAPRPGPSAGPARGAAGDPDSLLDAVALDDLRRHLGSDALRSHVTGLLDDLPRRLEQMRELWQQRDPDFHRRVHGLKGTAGLLGARRLATLCKQADDDYRGGRAVDGEALIADLEASLGPTSVALEEFLSGR